MSGKFEAGGLILFFISGVFFVLIAVRDGDALVMWSAAAWLLGVASFGLSRWGRFSR
jgi:hypothetical protein